MKEEKSIISIYNTTDLYAIISDHCAIYFAIEVVILTDEPALVAEPGWLRISRLTR